MLTLKQNKLIYKIQVKHLNLTVHSNVLSSRMPAEVRVREDVRLNKKTACPDL